MKKANKDLRKVIKEKHFNCSDLLEYLENNYQKKRREVQEKRRIKNERTIYFI